MVVARVERLALAASLTAAGKVLVAKASANIRVRDSSDGKFVAVGKSDEIRGLAGKGTQMFDAKGMTIVPGFIDCHNHAPGNVLLYEVVVGNPYVVEFVTIQSIVDKLKARAAKTPETSAKAA